ncbi:hypothetical protein UW163_01535 [Ralstonia solanacearum]|uniref:Uncharacterized protein n=1 Tax=Ralstonia solanacearum TaxID=305 RepID=A0A5H2Q1H7_RALSL|nr:hypothetical protein UW163_01535 [Ralstonia solanacearum]AMP74854.1 hypothetical protein RALBFv3_12055 [Ralstonia solanacearum]AYB61533.1 hypothetical protein C2124_13740 [Ralstonia solanacearum]
MRLYRDDQAAQAVWERLSISREQIKVCRFQPLIDSSNRLPVLGLSRRPVVERDANLSEAYFTTRHQTEAFAFGFSMRSCDDHPSIACSFTQGFARPVVLKLRVNPVPFWIVKRHRMLVRSGVPSFDFFHNPLKEHCWRATGDVLDQIIFQRTADSFQAQSRLLSTCDAD